MNSSRKVRLRNTIAFSAVLLCVLAFSLKLFDIQVVRAASLQEDALGKRSVPVTIPSVRGDIVDRNGAVLATTDLRFDVQLSPKNVGSFYGVPAEGETTTPKITADEALTAIGQITGQTGEEIRQIVDEALEENPESDFAYVKRSVDLAALNKLKALRVPWITFEQNPNRTYPNGAVAGNLIGWVGSENDAQAGLELSQDQCLLGTDGTEVYERGADGVALPDSTVVTQPVEHGGEVKLSIDRDLQWQLQEVVDQQSAAIGAEWGRAVTIDVSTGELVAVADDTSVDPNDIDASDPQKREARAFVDPYEPGSTYKMITAAALIDQGLANPSTPYLTPGSIVTNDGARFADSFAHGELPFTLTGILVQSSNVGTAMLGNQMSPATRYDYLQKFGIGQSTQSGMPLEDSGLLYSPEEWDVQTSYATMFGQGLSSTIVQTAGAYQALANGGVRIPPTLVQGCEREDGTFDEHDSGEPVTVVSQESAATTLHMLEAVVEESFMKDFVTIPGYRIAGKTGTAEQPDGQGGYRGSYVHSFAGVYPVDNPQFVTVVSFGHPTAGGDAGTVASLTAFTEAAEATIKAFKVAPSTGSYEPLPTEY